jgi:hypothetical protein
MRRAIYDLFIQSTALLSLCALELAPRFAVRTLTQPHCQSDSGRLTRNANTTAGVICNGCERLSQRSDFRCLNVHVTGRVGVPRDVLSLTFAFSFPFIFWLVVLTLLVGIVCIGICIRLPSTLAYPAIRFAFANTHVALRMAARAAVAPLIIAFSRCALVVRRVSVTWTTTGHLS